MAAVALTAQWEEHKQAQPCAPLTKYSTGGNWLSRAQTGILSNWQSSQKNQPLTRSLHFIMRMLSQFSFSASDCVLWLTRALRCKYLSLYSQGTIIVLAQPCSSAVLGFLKMRFLSHSYTKAAQVCLRNLCLWTGEIEGDNKMHQMCNVPTTEKLKAGQDVKTPG